MKCKYCLKPLDKNSYCTNCSVGRLLKKIAELKKKQKS